MERFLNALARCFRSRASTVITFLVLLFVINMGNPKVGDILQESLSGSILYVFAAVALIVVVLLFWKGKVWTRTFLTPIGDFFADGRMGIVYGIIIFLGLVFIEDRTFFKECWKGIETILSILFQLALYLAIVLFGFSLLVKKVVPKKAKK